MQISVVENVLKLNDELAAMNRRMLREAGVVTIDLIGAPGCGKTALLEKTLEQLRSQVLTAVIVGDLATQRDADRLARYTEQVVQINTGKGCHLEANHVRQGLERLDLSRVELLFIENVGNLICPVGFDLGQDFKVGMFGVCGGDDKAAKHPYLVCEADLLLLSKIDLLPHVRFDRELLGADIHRLNPEVELIELSVLEPGGMDRWEGWIRDRCAEYVGGRVRCGGDVRHAGRMKGV
jgi:hydrogenase nickel incorporation protein HypB